MRRIAILQLIYERGASIDRVVAEYGRSLDRTRYHHTVACLFGPPDASLAARLHADRVIFCQLPRREWTGLRLRALRTLGQLLREGNYRWVVCHRYKAMRLLAQWGYFTGLPDTLFVIHSLGYLRRRRWAARWWFPGVRYIAISAAVEQDIRASLPWLKATQVSIVHNTLDADAIPQRSRDEARQHLNLPAEAFVIGCVGRLVPFKDHATLIRAFTQIAADYPKSHLLIIGDGPLRGQLEQLRQESGFAQRIHLPGKIPGADALMRALDVFVLPSRNEPFGLVLLEAMAAELPLIASPSGGAGEVLDDRFARQVSDHTPDGFATALRDVLTLSAEQRRQRGQQARAHLQQHFSRSGFAALLEQLEYA